MNVGRRTSPELVRIAGEGEGDGRESCAAPPGPEEKMMGNKKGRTLIGFGLLGLMGAK